MTQCAADIRVAWLVKIITTLFALASRNKATIRTKAFAFVVKKAEGSFSNSTLFKMDQIITPF